MKVNLSPDSARKALQSLLDGSSALGFDVELPDGIDVLITNEVISDMGPQGHTQHVAPKHIAVRWHYKAKP